MHGTSIVGLVKFLSREYVDQFTRGHLYMNPLRRFVASELNIARRDEREGHEYWHNNGTLFLKIEEKFVPIPGIDGPLGRRNDRILDTNVFCMYAVRGDAENTPVDPRNLEFGDTFAVLRDRRAFLERVRNAAIAADQTLKTDLVSYVDKSTYDGPMGVFKKSAEFSYQSEFRIAMIPGNGEPFVLDVGNLADLVHTGPLAEINDLLRYVPSGQLPT